MNALARPDPARGAARVGDKGRIERWLESMPRWALWALIIFDVVGAAILLSSCSASLPPIEEGKVRTETRECVVAVLGQVSQNTWSTVQTCGEPTVVDFDPAGVYPQPVDPARDSLSESSNP